MPVMQFRMLLLFIHLQKTHSLCLSLFLPHRTNILILLSDCYENNTFIHAFEAYFFHTHWICITCIIKQQQN